jgi:hypothetical protein
MTADTQEKRPVNTMIGQQRLSAAQVIRMRVPVIEQPDRMMTVIFRIGRMGRVQLIKIPDLAVTESERNGKFVRHVHNKPAGRRINERMVR